MTLTIDGMEVTINVKKDGKRSKDWTMALLNEISLAYADASDFRKSKNLPATSENFSRISREIFNTLDNNHYYDECKRG